MIRTFIITGTDTDVGKTVFAAALVGALGGYYWKPVQAGLSEGSDAQTVARLSGLPPSHILQEAYRLSTPCSPHRAAIIDGVVIDPARLALPAAPGPLIVEGAGGALVPLSRGLLYADLFANWQKPLIIVARAELGTINHSLLTIEALRIRGVPMLGIAFIGDAHQDSAEIVCEISGIRQLGRLPRLRSLNAKTLSAAFAANFDLADFT